MVAVNTTATAADRAANLRALAKRDRKALLIEHKELSDLLTALEKERKGRSGRCAVPSTVPAPPTPPLRPPPPMAAAAQQDRRRRLQQDRQT